MLPAYLPHVSCVAFVVQLILLPKKRLQFHLGTTTTNLSLDVKVSGNTHRGCTKAEIGTVTIEMSTDVSSLTVEKKSVSISDQSNGFFVH